MGIGGYAPIVTRSAGRERGRAEVATRQADPTRAAKVNTTYGLLVFFLFVLLSKAILGVVSGSYGLFLSALPSAFGIVTCVATLLRIDSSTPMKSRLRSFCRGKLEFFVIMSVSLIVAASTVALTSRGSTFLVSKRPNCLNNSGQRCIMSVAPAPYGRSSEPVFEWPLHASISSEHSSSVPGSGHRDVT